jgi:hypothetical protein
MYTWSMLFFTTMCEREVVVLALDKYKSPLCKNMINKCKRF